MDYLIIPAIIAIVFIYAGHFFLKNEKINITYSRGVFLSVFVILTICFAAYFLFKNKDLIFGGMTILIGFNIYNSIFGVLSIILLNGLNKLNAVNYIMVNSAIISGISMLIIIYQLLFSNLVVNLFLLLNVFGTVFVSFVLLSLFSFFAKIKQA